MPTCLLCEAQGRSQFEMLSMSMDPQWCGLLFSLYTRQERWQLIGSSGLNQVDPFGFPYIGAQACTNLETDWIALASSIGLEICSLSSTWALIVETVKTTGLILLVGFGGLVCYKLYQQYGSRSRPPSPSSRQVSSLSSLFSLGLSNNQQLIEELTDDNLSDIQEVYFGPQCKKNEFSKYNTSVDSLVDYDSVSQSEDGTSEDDVSIQNNKSRRSTSQNRFIRNKLSSRRNFRHRKVNRNEKMEKQRFPTNTSSWLVNKISQLFNSNENYQFVNSTKMPYLFNLKQNSEKPSENWADDLKAMGIIPLELDKMDEFKEFGNSPQFKRSPNMTRDDSYDSLGFSKYLPHKGSFDSTCSDLSYDIPEINMSTSTIGNLDKIQQEINLLKSNCLLMDEDFETIKSNRNVPGMSSLIDLGVSNDATTVDDNITLEDKQKRARECFSGLYRLTTIPSGNTSSENSESSYIMDNDDSIDSLVWDSPQFSIKPVDSSHNINSKLKMSNENRLFKRELSLNSNLSNEGLNSLEWDGEEISQLDTTNLTICNENEEFTLLPNNNKQHTNTVMEESVLSVSTGVSLLSPITERSTTSGHFSKSDLLTSPINEFGCWSSEESGILDDEYLNMAKSNKNIVKFTSSAQEKSYLISERFKISDLSHIFIDKKMIKALHVIESDYKITHVRMIRADKFQPLSALLIQWILTEEGHKLVNNCRQNSLPTYWNQFNWLKNWKLPETLDPFKNGTTLNRLDHCLAILESTFSILLFLNRLSTDLYLSAEHKEISIDLDIRINMLCVSQMHDLIGNNNKEDYLTNNLNSNEINFIMILEALKILLCLKGIEIYNDMMMGKNIPIYVALLFSRPETSDPEKLANVIGHFYQEQNMNEEILSLVADTMGISLEIINPFKYGSEEFMQCLPKSINLVKPQVQLICENNYTFHIPFTGCK